MDSLNCSSEISEISILSINILPSNASKILNKLNMIVDLPAPVRPTIPIFSLLFIL